MPEAVGPAEVHGHKRQTHQNGRYRKKFTEDYQIMKILITINIADIDPPHEALQIRELFTEMNRMDSVKARPENFRKWLAEAQAAAEELETAIRGRNADDAGRTYARIEGRCKSCHEVFRNSK